ncbi:hypothetical protein [Dictyobacter arantiisoli]|uniref:Uncharacterized protein n=1 Tax=Dictyobacter arantiisoli TaxID=2014874 RepID=A0A5A5TBQ7_9CHLR|nr:hypothetical protein [Dictyobacter arantiisoli]GCF08665.1 hypothetical protein KDI_22290 [Dictyobacter arantiisoli]
MPTITIKDESLQGTLQPSWQLDIKEEQSTLREIIRCRILQDVSFYNDQRCAQLSSFNSSTLLGQRPADPAALLD